MDKIDLEILDLLQRDGRASKADIGRQVGLTPAAILERLRKLETSGTIRGYHADVDPRALGRDVDALISVRLSPKTGDLVGRLVDGLLLLDDVVAVTLLTGPSDLLVHVNVPDIAALRALVLDHIPGFDGVVDEQTMIVFERHEKHVVAPADS